MGFSHVVRDDDPDVTRVLDLFRHELQRAERKFPAFPIDAVHAAAIVQEEAGELGRAALHFAYEKGARVAMTHEAVQTGAMALRFLLHVGQLERLVSAQVRRT